MPFSVVRRTGLVLVTAAIGCQFLSHAQTLQHRPDQTLEPAPRQQPAAPASRELPKGTSLQVETLRHYPMRAGETIEGKLLHPIYADGRLVVPENTTLHGTVVALDPDSKTRWHARLRGDFTPFHTAEVRFDELMLPTGPQKIEAACDRRSSCGSPDCARRFTEAIVLRQRMGTSQK